MEHQQITANGINLHVVQDGPSTGQFVILLHGFPEFWYGWRRQIPHLAAAGYRVWAPDQRGYNLSDKPDGIAAYTLDELAADVIGLMDAAGQEKAFVVGHDWGAAVAWWVAAKYPARLARMVVINVPHGTVLIEHLWRNPRQMLKSWYMFFFQLPWLPETLARLRDWNAPAQAMRVSSRPGTFTDGDLDTYRQAWSQPKAYTSMLNWYRAVMQKSSAPPANPRITVPTLLIWGAQDRFLGRELAQPSIDLCDEGRLVFFEEATHWVQHEEADRVNELIDAFLRGDSKS
ncbi:MAG: alpha/beta hydrolase [Proteobacteria bacterium]|nr:alpha/beta hydrolase [Pseudomonadota bacterium]